MPVEGPWERGKEKWRILMTILFFELLPHVFHHTSCIIIYDQPSIREQSFVCANVKW